MKIGRTWREFQPHTGCLFLRGVCGEGARMGRSMACFERVACLSLRPRVINWAQWQHNNKSQTHTGIQLPRLRLPVVFFFFILPLPFMHKFRKAVVLRKRLTWQQFSVYSGLWSQVQTRPCVRAGEGRRHLCKHKSIVNKHGQRRLMPTHKHMSPHTHTHTHKYAVQDPGISCKLNR